MNTHCDRCGKDCRQFQYSFNFVPEGWLIEVKSIYQTVTVKFVCKKCGDKANSFVNYWGKKNKKDLYNLKCYLQSGIVSRKSTMKYFNSLMQAGYYD